MIIAKYDDKNGPCNDMMNDNESGYFYLEPAILILFGKDLSF
jgi:hypothetical protein